MKINTVTYTIQAPMVSGSVTTPSDTTITSKMSSGSNVEVNTGTYENHENVPVKLTFNGIMNLVNCVYVSHQWNNNNTWVHIDPIVVDPGNSASLYVTVTNPAEPVGHSDIQARFDVDVSIENVLPAA